MKRAGIHGAGMVSIGDMANGALGSAVVVVPPWWDPNNEGLCVFSAYQPKGAANFAASLVDLTGNGNDAIDPGGASTPAWDAVNGWKFDGVNDYLDTPFTPQNDQTQSVLVQFTDASIVPGTDYLCGSSNGVGNIFGIIPNRAGPVVRYLNGNFVNVGPGLLAGNLAVAGNAGYRNGAAEGGAIGAWAGAAANTVYIGAINKGFRDNELLVYIQAFAFYDCALTAPQVLAVMTAMAAL